MEPVQVKGRNVDHVQYWLLAPLLLFLVGFVIATLPEMKGSLEGSQTTAIVGFVIIGLGVISGAVAFFMIRRFIPVIIDDKGLYIKGTIIPWKNISKVKELYAPARHYMRFYLRFEFMDAGVVQYIDVGRTWCLSVLDDWKETPYYSEILAEAKRRKLVEEISELGMFSDKVFERLNKARAENRVAVKDA